MFHWILESSIIRIFQTIYSLYQSFLIEDLNYSYIKWNNFSCLYIRTSTSSPFCVTLNISPSMWPNLHCTHVSGKIYVYLGCNTYVYSIDLADEPSIINKLPVGLFTDHYMILKFCHPSQDWSIMLLQLLPCKACSYIYFKKLTGLAWTHFYLTMIYTN